VKAIAICDGRGNAGTGARAAVLYLGDGLQRDRHERAEKIPATTNIVAEHLAIQLAMELAKDHGVTELVIYNDSLTPVNHVNGNFKVKQEHLIPIVAKTREMRSDFVSIEIRWTRRENTKDADALRRAVDSPRVHGAEAAAHPRVTTSEHP
jgi:ribonuclease HI